ncbi:ankyrin repeat domain-containing protein 7-like isoform X2 [Thrips palmi]|nr:ankyrin repeat domain-containing protein 7-like isoform X2 [Thrips palmi]XP_034233695.1 ankyrin repeat domain-containing protein 7-like isoform X2 [Thrips palmi]
MGHYEDVLRQTIKMGDLQKFKTLVNKKNIDAQLSDGWTVLHSVCAEGQESFVEYVISCGASVNCDFEYFTPLMAICSSPSINEDELVKCAEILIEHKADVDAMDKTKVTPLMHACHKNHEKLVQFLLEHHCDVNAMDNDGYSALHLACMNNRPNIVKMLLECGADKHMKDRRGRLPLGIAISKEAEEIIQMLDGCEQMLVEAPTKASYEIEETPFERLLSELPSYTNSSGKDGFHNDVPILLSGMRLEQTADLFLKNKVSLAQFLNVTNDQLKTLGLYFSSHRSKIITGNKRFISHAWGEHSLPEENKDGSIMDVCRALANGVKHVHILFCTTLYCNNRFIVPTNEDDLYKVGNLFDITLRAHRQVKTLINELKLIQERVEYIDKVDKVKPVDLVLPIKHGFKFPKKIAFVTALCVLLAWRGNFLNVIRK